MKPLPRHRIDKLKMKTCLWCANPCVHYFKDIAPACHNLYGSEQEALRRTEAENCPDYVKAPQRFFYYSNGEPLTDY